MAGFLRRFSQLLYPSLLRINYMPEPALGIVHIQSTFAKNTHRSISLSSLNTSKCSSRLMEFFDDEKNWGEGKIQVGRAWKLDELRIKSNEDLHKLWYVLLKEKNMLLTMEYECNTEFKLFPNPERIDKVEESMNHLEAVVKERNEAYWMLEVGENGMRPAGLCEDPFGREEVREFTENVIPEYMNPQVEETKPWPGRQLSRFKQQLKEKEYREGRKYRRNVRRHVRKLLREFPDLDWEAVVQKYPDVEMDHQYQLNHKACRGNRENPY